MTETTKYKRRTFKEVEAEAYARGRKEGYSEGRKSLEPDMDGLLSRNYLLHARLSQGLWSRLTGLFQRS
jgi:hypothetical protein